MVDTSLFEAGITHTYWHSAICFATGNAPGPMGSAHPLNGPYQAFPASDGWITVGAANQENWLRLLGALEAPQLRDDPRFVNNAQRMCNLTALTDALTRHYFSAAPLPSGCGASRKPAFRPGPCWTSRRCMPIPRRSRAK